MGLLDAILAPLGGALGGFLGGNSSPGVIGSFRKVLSHTSWWDSTLETDTSTHEITCTSGQWTKIGRYQVKARQRAAFGIGNANQPDNQGYIHLAIYDDTPTDSVVEEGDVRFVILGYDDMPRYVIAEHPTLELRGSTTSRKDMKPLPVQLQHGWVMQDGYLVIEFNPYATDDVIATAIGTADGLDIWNIPATLQTLKP